MSAPARLEAPRRAPRNLVAVLLSLISGLGHIYLEHYLLGAVLFGVFVSALNGVFLASTLQTLDHPTTLLWASLIVLVGTWVGGILHAWRLSFGTDRPALERERVQLLRAGLLDYLRDDLDDAQRKLSRAVALDVDWTDPDPLFHLGVVQVRLSERHAKRGDVVAARRARKLAQSAFRRCRARDAAGKWGNEIEAEQKRLHRHLTGTGRLRALPPDVVSSGEILPPIAALVPEALPLPPPSAPPSAPPSSEPGTGRLPPARSSGRFPAARSSGSFPAARSSGSLPAARSSGSFPAVRNSGSFPAVRPEGGEAEQSPTGERPTPARAPGRTSRRLLAKRLKKLLQEELGDFEAEELDAGEPRGGDPASSGEDLARASVAPVEGEPSAPADTPAAGIAPAATPSTETAAPPVEKIQPQPAAGESAADSPDEAEQRGAEPTDDRSAAAGEAAGEGTDGERA